MRIRFDKREEEKEALANPLKKNNTQKPSIIDKLSVFLKDLTSLNIFLIILVISLVIIVGYLFLNYESDSSSADESSTEEDAESESQRKVRETLDALEELMVLPNEEPTIATITDINTLLLDNPEFYIDAENDDRLIIYPEKQIAIIFRPEDKRIINIAPVQIDSEELEGIENGEE